VPLPAPARNGHHQRRMRPWRTEPASGICSDSSVSIEPKLTRAAQHKDNLGLVLSTPKQRLRQGQRKDCLVPWTVAETGWQNVRNTRQCAIGTFFLRIAERAYSAPTTPSPAVIANATVLLVITVFDRAVNDASMTVTYIAAYTRYVCTECSLTDKSFVFVLILF
jgi:hypothetical protein